MQPTLAHYVDLLPEPAFIVRGDGEIAAANSAARELSADGGAALVGAPLKALLDDAERRVLDYLRLCARSRQPIPGAFTWRTRDGSGIEVRCDGAVLVPKRDDRPALILLRCRARAEATDRFALLNQKIAALSSEILERQKVERQRDELFKAERSARLEAERLSHMKDEFLATLSHELRTPLNAILGWAQLLRGRTLCARDTVVGLSTIERNARLQAQLIEDLLDISRIISGKVRLDIQRLDLAPIIEAAIESMHLAAQAKQISLQVAVDPAAGSVTGDATRLQQIVWNLLSNAVKFTPPGGRIRVGLDRSGPHLQLNVTDSGPGIRPELLPRVFDRFWQAEAATTRHHGGLGLGLAIVKHLTELHGGIVTAASAGEGLGATFTVTLPEMQPGEDLSLSSPDGARPQPAVSATADDDMPDLSGLTILIIDDEPDGRDLLRRVLLRHRATVLEAGSAMEALDLMKSRPDLLISDIGMPTIDGYELLRRVRLLPPEAGGRVPALAVTAFARTEDRTRAMRAGFNSHLAKPVNYPELIAAVASLARLSAPPTTFPTH